MGISFLQDFSDKSHLNHGGAKKYTEYLGKWLNENYDIPDRRGQSGYESWEKQI